MDLERDRRSYRNTARRSERAEAPSASGRAAASGNRRRTGVGRYDTAAPARRERQSVRSESTAPLSRHAEAGASSRPRRSRSEEAAPVRPRRSRSVEAAPVRPRTNPVRGDASPSSGRLPADPPARVSHAPRRRKKKSARRFLPFLMFLLALAILAVLVLALMRLAFGSPEPSFSAAREGISYLESLEAKDPAAIDEALAAIRKKRIEVERDLIMKKLLNDENDVWSMFHDYVILGDSRAVGFYYYDFLEKSRVLADGGDTIRKVAEHLEEIKALHPSYIFLCYGLNDVSIGYWDTPEEYTAEFMEVCAQLAQAVPSAKIIVSSILPARDPAFDISTKWREIPTYSAMLQAACDEHDILFVDNSQTAEDHAELWDIDGIHVRREFYGYWARNLIVAVIEDETYG